MTQRAFGLQHEVPGEGISDAWRTIVGNQARTLEGILRRLRDAAARIQRRTDDPHYQTALLCELAAETERLLTEEARQNIEMEQDIAAFRMEFQGDLPPETERRLRAMEQVNEVLHANLATARRMLEDMASGRT